MIRNGQRAGVCIAAKMQEITRHLLRAGTFGVRAAATVEAILVGTRWYSERPRAWDTLSITAQFDRASIDSSGNTPAISYVLSNETSRDYRIESGEGVRLAGRRSTTRDLVFGPDTALRIDYPVYVPANERSRVTLYLGYPCPPSPSGEIDVPECLPGEFGELAGFVLYDDTSHIRIDFPEPRR